MNTRNRSPLTVNMAGVITPYFFILPLPNINTLRKIQDYESGSLDGGMGMVWERENIEGMEEREDKDRY